MRRRDLADDRRRNGRADHLTHRPDNDRQCEGRQGCCERREAEACANEQACHGHDRITREALDTTADPDGAQNDQRAVDGDGNAVVTRREAVCGHVERQGDVSLRIDQRR